MKRKRAQPDAVIKGALVKLQMVGRKCRKDGWKYGIVSCINRRNISSFLNTDLMFLSAAIFFWQLQSTHKSHVFMYLVTAVYFSLPFVIFCWYQFTKFCFVCFQIENVHKTGGWRQMNRSNFRTIFGRFSRRHLIILIQTS